MRIGSMKASGLKLLKWDTSYSGANGGSDCGNMHARLLPRGGLSRFYTHPAQRVEGHFVTRVALRATPWP